MRLTCPNCAAQYEVPEDVIPDEGRDVQCSSCGQTWFQAAAGNAATEAAAAETAPEDISEAPRAEETPPQAAEEEPHAEIPADPPAQAAEPAPEAAPDTAARQDAGTDGDEPAAQAGAKTEPEAPPRPRGLDPAVSDILREEAEREASLRASDNQSLETQPDLGLEEATAAEDDAARRSRQARDRMARIRGEDLRQLAAAETGSRKELLPDIEEINSTLRSGGSAAPVPQAGPDELPLRRKSSFARGFSLSLIAALALVLIYNNAPLIAEKLPQMESALHSYVGWVDQARLWLDGQVKSLIAVQ